MDQPKIERILRLLMLLSSNVEYTIDELADTLETSPRTIYRYIDTFKSAGFSVEKVRDYVYKLTTLKAGVSDLSNVVYFSPEEAFLVNSLIDNLSGESALRQGLHNKLAAIYSSTAVADTAGRPNIARKVRTLASASEFKRAVKISGYSSSSSGKIKDYVVEPFEFTSGFSSIWAYDLADGKNKRFKPSRMRDVSITDEPWTAERHHRATPMDAFRIHGETEHHIVLSMNTVAKNIMLEEFPLTEPDISPATCDSSSLRETINDLFIPSLPSHDLDDPEEQLWIYDGYVRGLDGVGRFVLGLEQHIEVLEGDALKKWLLDRADHIKEFYEF